MATTVYKPVYVTNKTAKYDKVTAAIKRSYFLHADEHTKAFLNKIGELCLYKQKSIYTKVKSLKSKV